jgi:FtsP/CotA-like multicopper oxidase with cupredoxin domain
VQRRDFLRFGSLTFAQAAATRLLPAQIQGQMPGQMAQNASAPPPEGKADYTLRIAPVTVELSPERILSTIGYNGASPGPVLRMREGKSITVDVINATDVPELVHWHGLLIPSDVDGVEEEATPFVPPQGRRRYQFTPRPAGSRWYHSHAMAYSDLHRGSYTGQFGFLQIDSGSDPGQYDQEVFLALRDWEPFFTSNMEDTDEEGQSDPQLEKPAVLNTDPNGLEVNSNTYSINDKSLGAGEPIRVKEGQRVLFHLLNASAIENRRVALPGHKFKVIALDGNPVPSPQAVETLFLGAGERIDAVVEMDHPGVWILGATEDPIRTAGLGIVVEYANQHRQPQWIKPSTLRWDYTIFGRPEGAQPPRTPDHTFDMVFEKIPGGSGKFNTWLVNGKPYPHEKEFILQQGARYRLIFRNRTDDAHPMHLHRHQLELTEINGIRTSGIIKDTVVVPYYGRASVDFTADQPGLTLFHCHIQQHMDFGFKALFRYG